MICCCVIFPAASANVKSYTPFSLIAKEILVLPPYFLFRPPPLTNTVSSERKITFIWLFSSFCVTVIVGAFLSMMSTRSISVISPETPFGEVATILTIPGTAAKNSTFPFLPPSSIPVFENVPLSSTQLSFCL